MYQLVVYIERNVSGDTLINKERIQHLDHRVQGTEGKCSMKHEVYYSSKISYYTTNNFFSLQCFSLHWRP